MIILLIIFIIIIIIIGVLIYLNFFKSNKSITTSAPSKNVEVLNKLVNSLEEFDNVIEEFENTPTQTKVLNKKKSKSSDPCEKIKKQRRKTKKQGEIIKILQELKNIFEKNVVSDDSNILNTIVSKNTEYIKIKESMKTKDDSYEKNNCLDKKSTKTPSADDIKWFTKNKNDLNSRLCHHIKKLRLSQEIIQELIKYINKFYKDNKEAIGQKVKLEKYIRKRKIKDICK